MRRIILEVIAGALYYTGLVFVIGLVRRFVGRRRLLVLMYHHLEPARPAAELLHEIERGPAPGHFRGHMRLLRWFGRVIPLEAAAEELSQERRRPRALIAITFDDGYRDNLTVGLPALQRYRLPATVFPAVDVLEGGQRLWWDEVIRLMREAPGPNGAVDSSLFQGLEGWDAAVSGLISRREAVSRIVGRLAAAPMGSRQRLLRELRRRLGEPPPRTSEPGLYVTWEELRRMAQAGVTAGGHTGTHPNLTVETPDVASRQITDCRMLLEQRLGRPVSVFAYPGGQCNPAVRRLVAQAGYRVAVTVEHGVNYADTDPLALKRVPLSWEAPRHLALKLAFYDLVHRP